MNTKLITLFLVLLTATQLSAQQPAQYEPYAEFKEAYELFDRAKYGAAQEQFGTFLAETNTSSYRDKFNDLRADAEFYQAACSYHLLRNNAMSSLTDFIGAHPTHPKVNDAWYYTGKLHYIKKEYEAAIEPLREVELRALDAERRQDTRFMMAWSYYATGNIPKAGPLFGSLRTEPGKHKEASAYYYALIQYEAKNYGEAYKALKDIQNSDTYGASVPIYMANCLLKLKRYDELETFGRKIIDDNPRAKAAGELYLVLANAAYEQERYADAVEHFEGYLGKRGRMDRDMRYRLGYSYFKQRQWDKAREQLERCLRPEDAMAQNASFYLGHCFLELEDHEGARTAFRKAQSIDADPGIQEEALFIYGKIAFSTRSFEEALVAFQDLMNDYPDSEYRGEAESLMGEILLYSGRYKDAIEYFERSPLKNERSQKAYQVAAYNYALELYDKNLFDQSGTYFKKAFNLRYDKEIMLNAYYWYAEGKFREKDYDEAIAYYNVYLDQPGVHRNENHARAYYGLGWCYFENENYRQAGKKFSKYIAIAGSNENPNLYVDALLRAGDCEFVQKRYDNALSNYLNVRDRKAKGVDYALFQIGQCYQRQEDYKKSVFNFKELTERYRKSEFRDDALNRLADTYLNFLSDWGSSAAAARVLIRDYPRSPLVANAHNFIGTAEAMSDNLTQAEKHFRIVVEKYYTDTEASMIALENLSSILGPGEYDVVLKRYQSKKPGQNEQLCDLVFRTGMDRFYGESYPSAIEQFSSYLSDCPNGTEVAQAEFLRGQSYEKTEKFDQAMQDYEAVYTAIPSNEYSGQAIEAAAELMFSRGNYLSAMQLFSTMEDLTDKLEDQLKARFGQARTYEAMEDYAQAEDVYMGINTDPSATLYSQDRALVQIGVCKYHRDQKSEAKEIFAQMEEKYENIFGAESQYWLARIAFDEEDFAGAKTAGLKLKDNYPTQHYWRARVFLVIAEADLALGDDFQARGNYELLAREDRFPDVQEAAREALKQMDTNVVPEEEEGSEDEPGLPNQPEN